MVITEALSPDELRDLAKAEFETCVSLYVPTFRSGRETLQGAIRLKGLLQGAETELEGRGMRSGAIEALLEPARDLVEDTGFWNYQKEGLALFLSEGYQKGFQLPIDVPALQVVGGCFYMPPLLPLLSGDGHFYVLTVSEKQIRLFDATRFHFHEIELEDVPQSMAEALMGDDNERQLQFYTGTGGTSKGSRRAAMFFGTGDEGGMEQQKVDYRRYFDRVDAALAPTFRNLPAPVVLAGVSYLLPIYRAANTSAEILDGEVHGNQDRTPESEIHQAAWQVAAEHFGKKAAGAKERFGELHGTGLASDQPDKVLRAAESGRVDTLFVALESLGAEPASVDLDSNRCARFTLNHGGEVVTFPTESMPTAAPLSAIFRY